MWSTVRENGEKCTKVHKTGVQNGKAAVSSQMGHRRKETSQRIAIKPRNTIILKFQQLFDSGPGFLNDF